MVISKWGLSFIDNGGRRATIFQKIVLFPQVQNLKCNDNNKLILPSQTDATNLDFYVNSSSV